jgi:hypothetical protein
MRLWRAETQRFIARTVAVVLLCWVFVATTLAHPDYLAYFNETAGEHPERIAADSNLDWGQDLLRLAEYVRREKLRNVHVAYFGTVPLTRHLDDPQPVDAKQCSTGWIAISENEFHGYLKNGERRIQWPLREYKPVRRIGSSIWLYYIPEGACRNAT